MANLLFIEAYQFFKKENREEKMGYIPPLHVLGMNAACFYKRPFTEYLSSECQENKPLSLISFSEDIIYSYYL